MPDAASGGAEEMGRLLRAVQSRRPLQRIVVSEGGRVFFVPLSEVTHFTAEGNYVRVCTASGNHLVRNTLSSLEARLDSARFARIHRSEIVARDAVQELRPWAHGDYDVVLKTGERLRLSRRYRAALLGEEGERLAPSGSDPDPSCRARCGVVGKAHELPVLADELPEKPMSCGPAGAGPGQASTSVGQ